MEKNIEVKLTSELISRIVQEPPKRALKELIWNSCDADASKILVRYNINDIGGITSIEVEDDGHGIDYDNVEILFGDLGKSQKSYKHSSPKGRIYHGKLGQGRYKGLSFGEKITWNSRYNSNGEILEFDISCKSDDLKKIALTPKVKSTSDTTGVVVTIENLDESKANILFMEDEIKLDLLATFAPYLLAYKNIDICYNNCYLDPENHIEQTKEKIFEYIDKKSNRKYYCKALIIKWRTSLEKKIYICGDSGVVYEENNLAISKGISISVYLMSTYFDELNTNNLMTPIDIGYSFIVEKSNEFINNFVREELSNTAAQQIKDLKEEKIYPYEGEPENEIDKVERQIFDILTVEINRFSPKIRNSNKETKKLTYRLVKEALKSNSDSITRIFTEVFNLSREQQNELADLLNFTTLSSLINASKVISDRLLFINALEKLVYDKDISKPIKERTQFHKILLSELWIFGDKYTYGVDDVSLKNVLKEYIRSLGREDLIPTIPKEAIEDLTRIPDICLWQQYPDYSDKVENLVIELKRPSCVLSKIELDQIEDYAFQISQNNLFPKEKTKWNFIIIAKDYNDFVRFKLKDVDSKNKGNYYNSEDGSISISVKRWNELIHENKLKYSFLKEKLAYKIDDDMEGLTYVKSKYAQYFKGN